MDLIRGDSESRAALDESGDTRDWEKWYGHEETLCGWSRRYPNTLFCLHAEGEDSDGIWDKYFFDGRLIHTELFRGLRQFRLEDFIRGGIILCSDNLSQG